jgi:uncharacterized membrane-anchored protein YhcB (DUF1043 family)
VKIPTEVLQEPSAAILWVLATVITILTGTVCFFALRFVKRKDAAEVKILCQISKNKRHIDDQVKKIEGIATRMSHTALDIERVQVRFEKDVNKEMSKVKNQTTDIKNNLENVKSVVDTMSLRLASAKEDMQVLYETVKGHSRSLSMGAQSISKHNEHIKTLYKRIGDDVTLVTQEQPKGGKKNGS